MAEVKTTIEDRDGDKIVLQPGDGAEVFLRVNSGTYVVLDKEGVGDLVGALWGTLARAERDAAK